MGAVNVLCMRDACVYVHVAVGQVCRGLWRECRAQSKVCLHAWCMCIYACVRVGAQSWI